MKLFPAILLIVAILGASVFGIRAWRNRPQPRPPVRAGMLRITASVYPLAFFAGEVAGTAATVTAIAPAGAEPHEYEPTTGDIISINQSDIVIVNGAGLEPWFDTMKPDLTAKGTEVIIASEGLTSAMDIEENGNAIPDPHVWLDPQLAKRQAERIRDGLIRADPAHTAEYGQHTEALLNRLDELDAEFTTALGSCDRRDFVTTHTAFSYLASHYQLNQIAISGLTPESEPSPKDLARIADLAKTKSVNYIFFETLISPRLAETVAREIGAQTLVLNPIEGLTEKEFTEGKDYFSIQRENLNNLRTALTCH